jgi:hypothetical protein
MRRYTCCVDVHSHPPAALEVLPATRRLTTQLAAVLMIAEQLRPKQHVAHHDPEFTAMGVDPDTRLRKAKPYRVGVPRGFARRLTGGVTALGSFAVRQTLSAHL